jgi:hypothetical protein
MCLKRLVLSSWKPGDILRFEVHCALKIPVVVLSVVTPCSSLWLPTFGSLA